VPPPGVIADIATLLTGDRPGTGGSIAWYEGAEDLLRRLV
jgi:hypothetical protein